jgi:hypothetical protein
MVWPNLGWSDDPIQNRELANKLYYLHFTYRDMCKRAGHATNYGVSPYALAKHLKIKVSHATRFQLLYFGGVIPLVSLERWHKQDKEGGFKELIDTGEIVGKLIKIKGAFPGIRVWHTAVSNELKQTGCLITPMGRRRQFWSRLNDNSTLREAIAYVPQSTIGDLLNLGLLKVWNNLRHTGLDILAQVHDAILGQCYIDKLDTLMPEVLEQMNNPLEIKGRKMIIPSSVEVGYTWKDMKPWMK